MPILYLAIGRRLKYPMKLVRAKQHYFVRWDDSRKTRFNVECGAARFLPLDDEHFRCQPRPLGEQELAAGDYLRNLRPREELADFLCLRRVLARQSSARRGLAGRFLRRPHVAR